jgi:predicted aminopeptidase
LSSVSAAPPLSLTPRQWCYPIVGCVSYRGYFELRRASDEAALLRAQGDDVYVAPVQAYSTLGWFDDPVTSPLLRGPSWYTASVIFHELAHQKLYIADDTAFNEAYAVAVQREGERRWLARHGDAAQREQYARYRSTQEQFLALVRNTREQLAALYGSSIDDSAMLLRKQELYDQMRARFVQLRFMWGGYRGFDRWFSQDLNNAKMALVATYNDLVPRFASLIVEVGGDMSVFHQRVAQLAALDQQSRREGLPRLGVGATPGRFSHFRALWESG